MNGVGEDINPRTDLLFHERTWLKKDIATWPRKKCNENSVF